MNSNHDDNIANILFQNEHFIVIDKPHDVRMDGDFNITIKKLLVNTFPGTNESSFKWVHQLDFATSGTLCVAKTREAAALACLAFELRETVKEYIAVVEGHVNTSSWPVRNLQSLNNIKESIQESIVTSTPDFDTEPDTNSDQYMSSEKKYKLSNGDESSASWQDQVMSQNLKLCLSKLSTYLLEHCSESFEELNALSIIPYQSYCRNHKLRKRLRKGLKSVGIELEGQLPSINSSIDTAIGQVSTSNSSDGTDTTTGRATIDEIGPSRPKVSSIDTHMQELWRDDSQEYIFRLDSENHDSVTQDSENQYSEAAPLVIAVPLVEPLEDFRMDICPNSSSFSSARCVYSETWMYVIGHGYYQGRPASKVRLRLMTGRRHQLRVHCLSIGHPIVGDATYTPITRNIRRPGTVPDPLVEPDRYLPALRPTLKDTASLEDSRLIERESDERMMLHAQILRIPLPSSYKPLFKASSYFKDLYENKKQNTDDSVLYMVNITTPDPFSLLSLN